MIIKDLPPNLLQGIRQGMVIPTHPLALDPDRKLDVRHQRALTRYYIDAGAGGVAVGVHTTQFEIRDPEHELFKPVLTLASETVDASCKQIGKPGIVKIAGVCGPTQQACTEAEFALETGYHLCLLSLAALSDADDDALLDHCRAVAEIMPIMGFYLQPAIGGRLLSEDFWRRFVEIENVIAIKIAAFNRYQTLDVVRALAGSGRQNEISLYTGNDDNILIDLLTEYRINTGSGPTSLRFVGGLLGHWAVWTQRAVELLQQVHELIAQDRSIRPDMLTLAAEITDANAAFFDAAHSFAGCISGIHELLHRQGLMANTGCLNPKETLSPGQKNEIDRVCRDYPHLNDDPFVRDNLDKWLRD